MRTSFTGVRKYRSLIGKILMVLAFVALIGGQVWAGPKGGGKHQDRRYEHGDRDRYEHGRPHYRPYYVQQRVYAPPPVIYAPPPVIYAPPPVIYAPPPAPWGVQIFIPPIIIR